MSLMLNANLPDASHPDCQPTDILHAECQPTWYLPRWIPTYLMPPTLNANLSDVLHAEGQPTCWQAEDCPKVRPFGCL